MKRIKYKFPKDIINELVQISEGFLSPEKFEELLQSFESEISNHYFTTSSEANLLRIIKSIFDKVSFFYDCLKYPHHVEITVAIAAHSNYLTDIVVRNPEYLHLTFNPEFLERKLSVEILEKELNEFISRYKTFNSKTNLIRLFKRRYLLLVGINDIIGNYKLKTTTEYISHIAVAVNRTLFDLCHKEIERKYFLNFKKQRYCLISLGKLGGHELNYSSDADFIVIYDKNSKVGKETKREYFEILSGTIELFTQVSTDMTEKGFIYRVDFRLRPDGKNSPLCRTINDTIRYYETRGEDWEKQMLLKANYVCGSKNLYNQFADFLTLYIYKTSFSVSPLQQVARMKLNIEKQIGDSHDIKRVEGGIRDIEFSIQALQLINGSKFNELRNGNTQEVVRLLNELNFLSDNESKTYDEAYVFYRRIEHYIQLMNDRQTHEIPKNGELLEKLSSYFNFPTSKHFLNKVSKSRKEVRNVYNSIINIGEKQKTSENRLIDENLYEDKIKAKKNYKFLQSGMGLLGQKQFDNRTIALFNKISTTLYKYLCNSISPDKVLDNFSRIIKTIHFPSIWYSEFQNEKFFLRFLEICEYSQRAVDMLVLDKALGEFFISRKTFTKNLREIFDELSPKELIFILSIQFSLKLVNHAELSSILADYIKYILKDCFIHLEKEYRFFIIGQGSFGSKEISFTSDLDIIIVSDYDGDFSKLISDFEDTVQKAKEKIAPFELDLRLRPEGNNGPLVWDIKKYEEYFEKRARVWELQSLTKSDLICGNEKLFERFKKSFYKTVKTIDQNELIKTVHEMRNALCGKKGAFIKTVDVKKDKGSIVDIDFIEQFLLLQNKDTLKKPHGINSIGVLKLLKNQLKESDELIENFNLLKTTEHAIKNIFNVNNATIPNDKTKENLLSNFLEFKDADQFMKKIFKVLNKNRILFDKICK
ncbi:MAG: hypothetical protein JEY94_03660 [Melioribacteraceae bacterium]|nr:hypothetical protein [Melioribacteraceae bacterium]